MVSVSLIKVKLLTILSMVFMGLFSRLVLGFPMLLPVSAPLFHTTPEDHQFPDSGIRTSLRFMPLPRHTQKRRRTRKDGWMIEDELTFLEYRCDETCFDLVGEVIDQGSNTFNSSFIHPAR